MTSSGPNMLDQRMAELVERRVPFVRATVVRAKRPTSANPGDTALVLEDGEIEGFIGGACAEATVRRFALGALQSGEPVLLRISPDQVGDGDLIEGAIVVGNPCLSGGELEVFLEPRRPAPRVVVVGETPIGRSLVVLGRDLGYDIDVLDGEAVRDEVVIGAAAVVVASHGRDEEPVLVAALTEGVPYVALVASRKRAAAVVASLDVTPAQRSAVRAPAGLDIGAHTANEVALSILAEVVASVRGHAAGDVGPSNAGGTGNHGHAMTGGQGVETGAAVGDRDRRTSIGDVPGVRVGNGRRPTDASGADGIRAASDSTSHLEVINQSRPSGSHPGVASEAIDGVTPTRSNDRFQVAFAIDPTCGMTVAAVASGIHSDVTGDRQWFCCTGCRSAFEAEHSATAG